MLGIPGPFTVGRFRMGALGANPSRRLRMGDYAGAQNLERIERWLDSSRTSVKQTLDRTNPVGYNDLSSVEKGTPPMRYTTLNRNEVLGTSRFIGTFETLDEARDYAKLQASRVRSFATYEVYHGTPKNPGDKVPDTFFRGVH